MNVIWAKHVWSLPASSLFGKFKEIGNVLKQRSFSAEASFETKEYKLHCLSEGPSTNVTVTRDDAIKILSNMIMIRRMENAANSLYKEKIVRGFCHLYSGQEACAVGINAAMRDDDSVITAYRCHGWSYLMKVSPEKILSELTGRSDGIMRGKGGSMHMYSKNFYGGNGIVGAQVPLGAGVALAAQYKGIKAVCFAGYGDGAANQGQIFEAMNMAKLWALPCIFLCENNGFGMGTSSSRSSASNQYYTRGDYVPGIWVDGMDVLSVREATRFAIEYCDSGKGPIVMEAGTYRYYGHSMSDPGTSYRTHEDVQEIRKTQDPISNFKEFIVAQSLATEQECKDIEENTKEVIKAAVALAKSSKEIEVAELSVDIYADSTEEVRNVLPNQSLKHSNRAKAINV